MHEPTAPAYAQTLMQLRRVPQRRTPHARRSTAHDRRRRRRARVSACCRRRRRRAPATCSRTVRVLAWRIRSWPPSRRVSPSAASPRCATSSRTWSAARSGPTCRASRTPPCARPWRKPRAGFPALALFAGGKSFGGRMTSQAQAAAPLPGVRGLAFLGFPLHPAGKPSDERAAHLSDVAVPMLFLQGTRDELARAANCCSPWSNASAHARRCTCSTTPIIPSTCPRARGARTRRCWTRCWMRWRTGWTA